MALDTTTNFQLPLPDQQTKLTPNLAALAHRLDAVLSAFPTGPLNYRGTWNAATNTPPLASGVGTKGDYYVVSVSGSTNLDGVTDWVVGDWAVFNGTVWEKADHTDVVTSVFGRQGAVIALLNDYLASLVDNDSSVAGATVRDALNNLFYGPVTNEPSGFPNRTDTSISFVDGTRTFTIAPTGPSFDFYTKGVKFTKSGSEDVIIPNTEGLHYIHYDTAGVLQSTTTLSLDLFLTFAWIATIYWDATNSEQIYFGEERHGITMDGATHADLHFSRGTFWVSGLALNSIIADASGALDTHAQMGVDNGVIWDQDIQHVIAALIAPANIPVFYRTGALGLWRRDAATAFPVKRFGPADRLAWNEFTGGAWQQTEAGNNDYVLAHIFATGDPSIPVVAVQGQGDYGTINQARDGADEEINALILTGLPFLEFVPLATIIFQTANGYTNTVQARIRTTNAGEDYVDWRQELLSPTTGPSDHQNLANRTAPNTHPSDSIDNDSVVPGATVTNALDNLFAGSGRSALVGLDIDFSGDSIKTRTLTADRVFTISNPVQDRVLTIEFDGLFTIGLPASVDIINGDYLPNLGKNYLYLHCVDAATPAYVGVWGTGI